MRRTITWARRIGIVALASATAARTAMAQDAKPIAVGKSTLDAAIRRAVEELQRAGNGTMTLKFAV